MEKILLICDDIWHPAEVIEKGLLPLICDRFEVDVVKAAKDILTPELLPEYALIICCKSNNVTSGNPAPWFETSVTEVMGPEFQAYVEKGGAFLAVHSGNAFFGDGDGEKEYIEFVGNRFIGHPLRCEVIMRSEKSHPILNEVSEEFTLRDEHYQIELLAKDADIFLTSHSPLGKNQVAGYTRNWGQGKICVLTPGHTLSVWKHPDYQKIFQNAISWCLNK